MYVQVGDFRVSRGPPTVPLTQISCNTVISNKHKAGTLCNKQEQKHVSETMGAKNAENIAPKQYPKQGKLF